MGTVNKDAFATVGPHKTLELPIPPRVLHPNAPGAHWRLKAKATRKHLELCTYLVREYCLEVFGKQPKWRQAVVGMRFVFPLKGKKGGASQRHDPDNLVAWSKASIDSLTKGGLIADDREIVYLPVRQIITGKEDRSDFVEFTCWEGTLVYPGFLGG